MSETTAKTPLFIFHNPRTCSQLLGKFFSDHPQLDATPGKFHNWAWTASVAGPDRLQSKFNMGSRAVEADQALVHEITNFFGTFAHINIAEESLEAASGRLTYCAKLAEQEGKIPLIQEHRSSALKPDIIVELVRKGSVANPPSNPTNMSDELYASMQHPAILIRHPALVIPSYFRAQKVRQNYDVNDEIVRAWTTQRSARFLYEHIKQSQGGRENGEPLIIDADDVVHNSKALCDRLCAIWSINPAGVQFQWEPSPAMFRLHPLSAAYRTVVDDSTGILKGRTKDLEIDGEHAKWTEEFGRTVADRIRELVEADIPDYEHLKKLKLQL